MRERYIAELAVDYAKQTGSTPDALLDLAKETVHTLISLSRMAANLNLGDGRPAPFIEAVLKLAIELNASGAELAAAQTN